MKSLFDKTELAGMKLKNRFVRSATYEGVADEKGHATPALFAVYENLAKGGVGTIITGLTFVSDLEQVYPGQLGICDDSFIDEYQKLTAMIHRYDANIIMQLTCNGPQTPMDANSGKTMWGPSAVEDLAFKNTPKEMTQAEISFVQTAFAAAALRAKQAGFDGVQIHAAHGYLLSKFLTPYYNRRTDEYGGNIENRARMVLETYAAIRARVGAAFPVLIKINSEDFIDQGMTFADCKYVCKKLAEMGINAIEISGGTFGTQPEKGVIRAVTPENESYFKSYAAEIAQENKTPVILVGGNRNIENLTKILQQTAVEYISLCRPLIYESDLINRWQSDTAPAKCISCNKCFRTGGTACIFNRRDEAAYE